MKQTGLTPVNRETVKPSFSVDGQYGWMKPSYALLRRPVLASSATVLTAIGGMAGALPVETAFGFCALFSAGSIALSLGNRRSDRVRAAERARTLFLSNIGHEIRTPLNGILGMTGLVLDTSLTPEQRTYVNAAKESGETLSVLLEDLLALSDSAGGAMLEIKPRKTDVIQLVESIGEIMVPRAWATDLDLVTTISPGVDAVAELDEQRVRQVLMSLLSQSLNQCQSDGVMLTLSQKPGAAPNTNILTFEIVDTGAGFPSNMLTQAHSQSQVPVGRADLGLMAAKRIATPMAGKIDIENTVTGGRARLSLPVPAAKTKRAPRSEWPVCIVISSSAIVCGALKAKLAYLDRDAFTVPSINHAKARIVQLQSAGTPIGHILIDAEGVQPESLADQLKALNGMDQPRLTSVLMLRPSERKDLDWVQRAGFAGYLMKPVRLRALRRRLNTNEFANEASGSPNTPQRPDTTPTIGPMRILLVEDNDINATLATALLTRSGHYLVRALNGAEAINRAAKEDFDLILMDLNMPVLNGFESARKITAKLKEKTPPIVAFSANSYDTDIEECKKAGMIGHMTKPIDIDVFHKMLSDISGQAKKSQAA